MKKGNEQMDTLFSAAIFRQFCAFYKRVYFFFKVSEYMIREMVW